MANAKNTKIIRIKSTISENYSRMNHSITPLLIWLQVIGINLPDHQQSTSSCRSSLFSIYGLFCFLVHLASQVYMISLLHDRKFYALIMSVEEVNSETVSWNLFIDFINIAVIGIGSHFLLLFIVRGRWGRLLDAVMSCTSQLSSKFYDRLRKISIFGSVYVAFLFSCMVFLEVRQLYIFSLSKKIPVDQLYISVASTASDLYPTSAMILFCTLNVISAENFQSIRQQIRELNYGPINNNEYKSRQLAIIQDRHLQSCEVVNCLNSCFGYTLLLSISSLFVSTISRSFYVFGESTGIANGADLLDYAFGAMTFLHLGLYCLTSSRVVHQANAITNQLLQLEMDWKHDLVNLFLQQVVQTQPKISAVGFFDVSKKLIPQAIGTALTYFFIIFQFKSSEKNAIG